MAISINKLSKEIQEQIVESYQNGMSIREIERIYGATRPTVSNYLEKIGVKTVKGNHYKRYSHNEDFFETINTEEKAYWLGFMYADGWIQDNSKRYGQDHFGITLADQDEAHLQKFLNSLNATNIIRYDNSGVKKGWSRCAKIELTSQKTVDDLVRHGCLKRKTLILQPPTTVPEELLHHFIRGFFDGDGSIIKTGGEYYEKYHKYNFSISFSCVESIAYWLQDYFKIGSVVKDKRKENSFAYSIGGINAVENFYHMLYDDATVYLDRKYERFQEFLSQKYNESQGS